MPPAKSHRGLWITGAAVGVVVLGAAVLLAGNYFRSAQPPVPDPGADNVRAAKPSAGTEAPATPDTLATPRAPVSVTDTAAKAPASAATAVPPSAAQAPSSTLQPPSAAPSETIAAAQGTVRLAIKPWGEILVDGVSQGVSPPLKRISLPEGKHRVEITNPGFPSHVADIEVAKNQPVTVSYEFK
jgi:non-specific serine/threonine protein kinase